MKIRNKTTLNKRNFLVCKLTDEGWTLKELADMFDTTTSNICHIRERHLTKYYNGIKTHSTQTKTK